MSETEPLELDPAGSAQTTNNYKYEFAEILVLRQRVADGNIGIASGTVLSHWQYYDFCPHR